MTDEEFIEAFENCSLVNESFHHSDHVRMAFLYLSRDHALDSIQRFCAALVRFATANGKPELYHETVTWAFLFLIRERMIRGGGLQTWSEFAAGNEDLLASKDFLRKYYREETLASEFARRTFVLPDKGIMGG